MKFALITEGPSEHKIIKHIVAKYFKEIEPEINQIQPKIANDRQETPGGWNEVLKYCEREELNDIFIENDFLIIQIDTDQSQTKPFSVSHNKEDNSPKTADELYIDVVEKLKRLIKPGILDAHNGKMFFAICIETIECWLLPLCFENHHRANTRNCLSTLNTKLRTLDIKPIPKTNKNSPISIKTYETILKKWRKRQDIIESSQHNAAFKMFIDSINVLAHEDPLV